MTNETVTIAAPEAATLITDATGVLTSAEAYAIDSAPMYQLAAEELQGIKKRVKDLNDRRVFITKPLDEAKARVMDLFRRPLEILGQAETLLKRSMLNYQNEQERLRQERETEARRAAAEETERLRREQEKQAAKLEKKGNVEEAAAVRAAPVAPVPVVVAPVETPKVKGISTREVWKARVVDAARVPREYLVVNDKMLAQVAQATKGQLVIPGVEFYSEQVLASGRAS